MSTLGSWSKGMAPFLWSAGVGMRHFGPLVFKAFERFPFIRGPLRGAEHALRTSPSLQELNLFQRRVFYQTGKATERIASQIADIQQETGNAVDALGGITETIGKISEVSASVAAAVEEQAAATKEITRNVEEAAKGTQEVNENISQVSKASQETGAASSQMQSASQELAGQADQLNKAVSDFLNEVRAA